MTTKITIRRENVAVDKKCNLILKLNGYAFVCIIDTVTNHSKTFRVGDRLTDAQVDELCNRTSCYDVTTTLIYPHN